MANKHNFKTWHNTFDFGMAKSTIICTQLANNFNKKINSDKYLIQYKLSLNKQLFTTSLKTKNHVFPIIWLLIACKTYVINNDFCLPISS